jgi:hypothetical protein
LRMGSSRSKSHCPKNERIEMPGSGHSLCSIHAVSI